mgnify:CR=1 FL=1
MSTYKAVIFDWAEDDVEKLTLCLRRNFWESSISLQK